MTDIQWYPGHMAKAKRVIQGDLPLVDIIIEVIDARVPYSSRNPEFTQIMSGKPQLIVLNKMDLASGRETELWLNYYRNQGYGAVAANGNQKQGIKRIIQEALLLAEPLYQKLTQKGRNLRPVRAMVVGAPNTGKSTIINALSQKNVTKTANKPGVTKGKQWVKASSKLELLDTPGVLWPKFTNQETAFRMALTGAINDQVFNQEEVARKLLLWLKENYPQALIERYNLDGLKDDTEMIMADIGCKRGLLTAGGKVNMLTAAILLITEFRSGKLGSFTLDNYNP